MNPELARSILYLYPQPLTANTPAPSGPIESLAAYYGLFAVVVTLGYTFYLYRIRTPPADLPYVAGMFLVAVAFAAFSTRYFYDAGPARYVTRIIGYTLILGIATWWMWCLRGDVRGSLHRFFLESPRFSRATNGDDDSIDDQLNARGR